jgi:hypothetical protein
VPISLAELVRKKLQAGTLPREQPLKFWTSIGSGKPCMACDEPILPSQTEYEGQYYDDRPPLLLHVHCHRLWEGERHRHQGPH